MATFQVPVWFNVEAENAEAAWLKVRQALVNAEKAEQLPDYIVEEPVEIKEEN